MESIKFVVRPSRTRVNKLSVRVEGNEDGSIRDAITERFKDGDVVALTLHRRGTVAVGQVRQWKGLPESFGQPHSVEALTFEVASIYPDGQGEVLGRYLPVESCVRNTSADVEFVEKYSVVLREPGCRCLPGVDTCLHVPGPSTAALP